MKVRRREHQKTPLTREEGLDTRDAMRSRKARWGGGKKEDIGGAQQGEAISAGSQTNSTWSRSITWVKSFGAQGQQEGR